MPPKRQVFFVSDHTGITAEAVGKSIISQFIDSEWEMTTLPFISTPEKAVEACSQIRESANKMVDRPVVISTILDREIFKDLSSCNALVVDALGGIMQIVEQEVGYEPVRKTGLIHALSNDTKYANRINAVQFSLDCDDGNRLEDALTADVILVGISRSGKTPVSLYLAMQNGIKAANYPLTELELEDLSLPPELEPLTDRMFGLLLDIDRMVSIRQERMPGTYYASYENCERELHDAEEIYRKYNIPSLNATHLSIEEIATKVLESKGLLEDRLD